MNFDRALGIMMFLAATVAGCSGGSSNIVIKLDSSQGAACDHLQMQPMPHIEVMDIRKNKEMEKTTIGGISLGKIDLQPPEVELVRNIVENTLCNLFIGRTGPADMPVVYCGIRTFDISTPATPLYWDVVAKIELILRVHGEDHVVSGTARERTWIWPGMDIIHRVVDEALVHVAVEMDKELKAIF